MLDLSSFAHALQFLFGGDFPPPDPPQHLQMHQAMIRGVFIYLVVLAIIRLGKSRSIGRMSPLDVLLGFILGSLVSRGITGHASLSGTAGASAALVAVHWVLTRLACQWHWFGDLVKGHADLIVENGQPLRDNMLHHHISMHDLDEFIRTKGIDGLSQVRRAYKERNGEVSVLPKKEQPTVLDVAVENGVQTVRLKLE
jgi:uncharacterized membrane protein YcaP (DUF421 family)